MAIAHHKCIMINADNMKLILDIDIKIGLNYFGLINASDYSVSAVITYCLCAAPVLPTTAAAAPLPPPSFITIFLSFSGTVRVSVCQITDIKASVQFTKPVLEKQEKKKKEKKKKK
ncbi:uncharacterized protein CIMG_13310 [Coccidioides immitis RS]|uniref:Uncharacterized protein n=1 Tax=Coccidioides immitis (strain RS) TaxID=246410 RepID=J3K435_COCIM|nr:uncharacterized protein CIMG_13310 [Coccidioides immitis RS]EAS29031.3 hypothetical protein CIMG_13310 [Coccidioides immitis RS]